MTVHRVGPSVQHRTDLGRVLITIDDLAALKTFLTRNVAGLVTTISDDIEFDGGYFTEPEDLRTLSDIEMQRLRLKSPKVEVVLNPAAAFAIGDRQEAEDVYRLWARARQTRIRPGPMPFFIAVPYSIIAVLLTNALLFWLINPELTIFAAAAGSAFCLLLAFLVGIFFFWSPDRRAIYRDYSYAVIVPLSLAEHRQNLSSQVYPRRTWTVAIVAIIVTAAVTIGIFILSNVVGGE
jgi:hypothetical protein